MESRKRAKQPLEQDGGNVKRIKHAVKTLFRGEGSTEAGASNTLLLEDEPSDGDSDVDDDINQPITANTTTGENQNGLADASQNFQNPRVNATSTKKSGLKKLLKTGVLGPVADALGPIKQVAEIFVECVDTYKVAEKVKVEHDELIVRLEGLFEDLIGHFDDGCFQPMTTSMKRLCKSIQEELETLKNTKGKNKGSRYLAADDEADVILACYRRVEGYLERLSLNANLSTWKIAHEQATNYQSDRMFSLIDRLPSVLSARYNSSEGEALKRGECTAGTRVREIAKLLGWVRNKGEESMYWLNGMAGTGKTTIAYSVCAGLDSAHMLGASFFCSRLREECRNLTVVIDALDECEDKESTRRMLEVLLNESTNLPIRFVLSTRPEPEIRDQMIERVKSRLVLHELDKDEVRLDIETYLRAALVEMKPSEDQVAALVAKSGILFIYAATAVRYIGYDNFQSDPHDRLRDILAASGSQEDGENEEIDQLYITVLEAALGNRRLRKVERDNMQQVLHTVVCARDPLTVSGLSELLRIHNPDRVRAVLRPLWSVLHIIGESELVTTLHASFPDFMFDSSRSKAYSCDSDAHNHTLAEHCFSRIRRAQPRFNICGLDSAYLPGRLVPNIEKRIMSTIPSDLFYACRYWADHFGAGKYTATLVTQLEDLVSTRLLLWMEVLNLKKHMRVGMECMKLVIDRCNQLEVKDELMDLWRDAQRFVDTFTSNPISQSTPHIYVSMLAFWPKATPIAEHYAHLAHGPVLAEGTALDQQQIARLATWTFDGPIKDIAISPDGRHMALAVGTRVLVVDASSGQVILGPLHGHSDAVRSVIFSPNQSRVISGSWSHGSMGAVVIGWDTCTGDTVLGPLQLDGHTGEITFLSFSPKCTRIVTCSYDGVRVGVHAWSAAFSSDGGQVAAVFWAIETKGPDYPVLQVWSTQNDETTLGPLRNNLCMITFSPDNSHIAPAEDSVVCVRDAQTVVWDVHTGEIVLGPLEGHTGEIQSIAFSPDGSYIISGCNDGRVCEWNARRSNSVLHSTSMRLNEILSVKFSPDGTRFVSGSKDGIVCVWDASTGEIVVGPIEGHTAAVTAVDFSNHHIASFSDGTMCVFSALSGDVVLGPIGIASEGYVEVIAYSPDGSLIATASAGGLAGTSGVKLWDAQTGARVLGPLKTPSRSDFSVQSYSIQFSPDGTRIVGSKITNDLQIVIWDTLTGHFVSELLIGFTSHIFSVSYSPNGALVASACAGHTIIVWDAYTGTKKLGPLTGHTDWVNLVSFSPDNSHLISGSNDKTIRIWDVQTGEIMFEILHGHEQGIGSVTYSPDGTRIMSLCDGGSVRIHEARSTGEQVSSYVLFLLLSTLTLVVHVL
ncbi:putative WD repeat-containing protein all2124 [Nostoc sp, PCC 7120] [Rhizoctonia solani]|uniref:Putative WD repeat-containing protein all2124 [Nostoc sp, PCC 7120] n=1 Tax=Rhizoctonia solani TaxID=456999 RepID=A0A0K6FV93_9AGAM|nr:putative WD repeat-containing protein all2124 [Nostoc sp, PCC 7120] [Rhizoctonia solani]